MFGFLTSSSTTRLYRGRAPRQERLTILRAATHETELGDHDFCLSRSHYTDTDPTCRERAATAGIEPGTSSPGVARSTTELPRPPFGKFAHVSTNLSPPATSDLGIKVLFLDHENGLSAISGITFVNTCILKASHFLGCFRDLRALGTNPIFLILHIVRISRRGIKTCTSEKTDLSLTSSATA